MRNSLHCSCSLQAFVSSIMYCSGFCELPEPRRLAALKYAASLGAAYVDIEHKVAPYFFEGKRTEFLDCLI